MAFSIPVHPVNQWISYLRDDERLTTEQLREVYDCLIRRAKRRAPTSAKRFDKEKYFYPYDWTLFQAVSAMLNPPSPTGHLIYLIGADGHSFVKIGTTELDVDTRMRQLQVGSPFRLKLLGAVPGGYELESELHEHFADRRACGEWFDFSDKDAVTAVRDYIKCSRWALAA